MKTKTVEPGQVWRVKNEDRRIEIKAVKTETRDKHVEVVNLVTKRRTRVALEAFSEGRYVLES